MLNVIISPLTITICEGLSSRDEPTGYTRKRYSGTYPLNLPQTRSVPALITLKPNVGLRTRLTEYGRLLLGSSSRPPVPGHIQG